jgi:hypothetical protein
MRRLCLDHGQIGSYSKPDVLLRYIELWQSSVEEWGHGGMVRFDGTIDKHETRHTDLWIDISEEDVVALFDALVKAHRHRARELETWNESTAPPSRWRRPEQASRWCQQDMALIPDHRSAASSNRRIAERSGTNTGHQNSINLKMCAGTRMNTG